MWHTTSLTFNNCTLCPHCIYVFCIYLSTNSDLCQLDAQIFKYILLTPLHVHVSSNILLILRRSNCINTASGIVTVSKWPSGAPVDKEPCALSWSLSKVILRCTVSETSKFENLKYEDKHYWVARLGAIGLYAPCLKNCLICSLPSGPLCTYFCEVFIILFNWRKLVLYKTPHHTMRNRVFTQNAKKVISVSATLNFCHIFDTSKTGMYRVAEKSPYTYTIRTSDSI
jgi:hypothetical protein